MFTVAPLAFSVCDWSILPMEALLHARSESIAASSQNAGDGPERETRIVSRADLSRSGRVRA